MKKILVISALAVTVASTTFGQGTVLYGNGNSSRVSTNSVAGGAQTGLISGTGAFYFALFYSASATTVNGASTAISGSAGVGAYVFNDVNWTFNNPGTYAGFTTGPGYGTDATSAGTFQSSYIDPNQNATIVPFTSAAQFVVLGWSANIGTTLLAVENWYNGGALTPGWIGESVVSGPITPGDPNATPVGLPAALFGSASTAGVMHGFLLGMASPVPEPTTMALAGLGGLSLLLFRRRK